MEVGCGRSDLFEEMPGERRQVAELAAEHRRDDGWSPLLALIDVLFRFAKAASVPNNFDSSATSSDCSDTSSNSSGRCPDR